MRTSLAKIQAKMSARPVWVAVAGVVLLGLIGLADYLSGTEISAGVFYFLPIWLMTWHINRRAGVLCSVVCALVWLAVDEAGGAHYSSALIPFWNAGVRLIYFLTFAFLLSNTRNQLNRSKAEVKQLSGLLPICASCKRIRNDRGNWEEIEGYISRRSDTDFSHGICPECAKKLYPEFSDDLLKKWKETGR